MNVENVRVILERTFQMSVTESDAQIVLDRLNENIAGAVCEWKQADDEESNNWESSCGDIFFFEDGTPEENGIKFCPFCSHRVSQKLYESEPEDDDEAI